MFVIVALSKSMMHDDIRQVFKFNFTVSLVGTQIFRFFAYLHFTSFGIASHLPEKL